MIDSNHSGKNAVWDVWSALNGELVVVLDLAAPDMVSAAIGLDPGPYRYGMLLWTRFQEEAGAFSCCSA